MLDITASSVIPLLIASITATTIAFVLPRLRSDSSPSRSRRPTPSNCGRSRCSSCWAYCAERMSCYFTTVNSRIGAFYKRASVEQGQQMALRRHHAGRPALRLPAALRRGLRGLHLADARRYPHALFNTSLFYRFSDIDWVVILYVAAIDVLQGGGHVLDQRRGRRGRNLRAVAVRRRLHGRHRWRCSATRCSAGTSRSPRSRWSAWRASCRA